MKGMFSLSNIQRLTDRFIRYVKCGSESGNEAEFCKIIENELKEMGLIVTPNGDTKSICSNGWNIYACLPGNGDPILFSAHLDTVSPGNNIVPIINDGVIYSSGDTVLGADDKAGIAAVMEALEEIIEKNESHRTIEILFTVCEEIGMLGSKSADYSNIKSKNAIVLDSDNFGEIINKNPANVVINYKINGKSAHAGLAPQEGIHALKAAADAVANLPVGNVDDISVMNISNFISKGKTNIIADEATFDMEIRSFEEDRLQKHIMNSIHVLNDSCDKFGANYEMTINRHSDVIYVDESSRLIKEIKKAFTELGVQYKLKNSFGGCDATNLFANGFEVVNLGIGMQAVHSCSEYISQKDLAAIEKLVLIIMKSGY